ncbi:DUF7507 domain-containing protein [Chelativorans xinjiangense]|uniref:DUF7507 domain-containing protein n=1 Tax=Chelativorans xinjiangense TaxID=2681485 RepID=UPI001356BD02|nr:DUF11 domain-containing protein [Chelativorans xinjiangense]
MLPGTTSYRALPNSTDAGTYAVVKNPDHIDAVTGENWQHAGDHTTGTEYMAIFNADPTRHGEADGTYYLFRAETSDVPGATYRMSYWTANLIAYDAGGDYYDAYIGLTVRDQPGGAGTLYAAHPDNSTEVPRAVGNQDYLPWIERTVNFQLPVDHVGDAVYFNFFNSAPDFVTASGNDLAIDDLLIEMARARISGRIYVDNNTNGVFDAGDETVSGPLPYVAVVGANDNVIDFVQIAADGTYLLENAAYSTADIGQRLILLDSAPELGQVAAVAPPPGYAVVSETPNATYGTTGALPLDGILNVVSADSETGDHPDFDIGLMLIEADLQITKDGGEEGYVPGADATYTIEVSNDGPFGVQNALMNDPLPAGITDATWTCGSPTNGATCGVASGTGAIADVPVNLPVGSSVTFTHTLTVPLDFTGDLVNTATVTNPGDTPDPAPESNTSTVTKKLARLEVEKTGAWVDENGDGFAKEGEPIEYTITVKNTGDVPIFNIAVEDPLIDGFQGTLPNPLDPGGSATLIGTYTLSKADIDNGSVTNSAKGTGETEGGTPVEDTSDDSTNPKDEDSDGDGDPDDPTETDFPREGALDIIKTGTMNDENGDGFAEPGETITYTFTVENIGDVTLTDITLTDTKIAVVGGPLAKLDPGDIDNGTFTGTYTITEADIESGSVKNLATGTGKDPDGKEIPPAESHGEDDVPGTQTETKVPFGDGDFVKEALDAFDDRDGSGSLTAGDRINYKFTITNTGNIPITNIAIEDPDAVIEGTLAAPIPAGGTDDTSFTGWHAVTQEEINAGLVANVAEMTATVTDEDYTNDFKKKSRTKDGVPGDPTEKELPQEPQIRLEMEGEHEDTDGDGVMDVGEPVRYTMTVCNTGNVTLSEATVTDSGEGGELIVDGGPPPELGVGECDSETFTGTHILTQEDIDRGYVEVNGLATGQPPVDEDGNPVDPVTDLSDDPTNAENVDRDGDGIPDDPVRTAIPEVSSLKVSGKESILPDGFVRAGDKIEYRVTIENVGNVTAKDVAPEDPGPSFNGKRGTGMLSAFKPASVASLAPEDDAVFTAVYTLSQEDVANAAGVTNGVTNTATAIGISARDGEPVDTVEEGSDVAELPGFNVSKTAHLAEVRRGQRVPYTITMAPLEVDGLTEPVTLIDTMPAGFTYIEGTATVGGMAHEPKIEGRRLIFEDIPYAPDEEIVVDMQLGVSAAVKPGKFVNRAQMVLGDSVVDVVSNVGMAEVEVVIEPIFDCGDVIGKVFDDINRNGYQDEGEPGLPGVRVATVKGLLITTDKHGRFNVACADLPDGRIGSTFVMKLDPRTLPTGYRIVSENPRTVRLTAGKASRLNFAATIGRVVRVDLNDAAFEPGMLELRPEWQVQLPGLIALLEPEESVLRLAYVNAGADRKLAANRMKHIRRAIGGMWKERPRRYRLEIETRIETRE